MNKRFLNVLLVEDDPGDASLVKVFLVDAGQTSFFNLSWVKTVSEGLAHLSSKPTDVLLLDMTLPDSAGVDPYLTFSEKAPKLPIILLTEREDVELASRMVRAGAQDYLVKGQIDNLLLGRSIRYAIERKQSRLEIEMERDKAQKYLDVAGVMMLVIDNNRQVSLINAKGCQILGYELDEIIGKFWIDTFIPERYRLKFKKNLDQMLAGELGRNEYFEKPVLTNRGEERLIAWHNSVLTDDNGNVTSILSSGEDITERKQAQIQLTQHAEELRQRNIDLAFLYDAGLTINSEIDPYVQLEKLLQVVTKALVAENADFFHYDASSNELHFDLGIGYPDKALDQLIGMSFKLGEEKGIVGRVAQERKAINLPDVHKHPDYFSHDPEILSGLWVPVIHGDSLLGVLGVLSTRQQAFSKQDEQLLTMFANQAAGALENARRSQAETRRSARLTEIWRLGMDLANLRQEKAVLGLLVNRAAGIMKSATCTVLLIDRETDEAVLVTQQGLPAGTSENLRIPLEDPLIQRSITSGEPIILSDIDRDAPEFRLLFGDMDAKSFFAYPMTLERRIVGFMTLSRLTPHAPSVEEIAAGRLLADRAVVAMESVRLFEMTLHRLKKLQALQEIDIAISSSVDLRLTFNVLLQQVTTQLGVDAADILLFKPITQTLEYGAGQGFRTGALQHTHLRLGEGLAGKAALERRTVLIPNLVVDPEDLANAPRLEGEDFITYVAAPLIAKGQIKGVLEVFHRQALKTDTYWMEFLETLAGQTAIAIDNVSMFDDLQRSNIDLTMAYNATIEGWSHALDLRDKETEGHTLRVTDMTLKLARRFDLGEEELVHMRRGALLHDIGKMGIPDGILLKPGPLTEEEWVVMKMHPVYANEMLSPIRYLRTALDIPYCHHEKWDGTGYPRGLKGEQIPITARIFAVVDVWDALTSDRPYRKAWSNKKVRQHIQSLAGTHFDPQVVEQFFEMEGVGG